MAQGRAGGADHGHVEHVKRLWSDCSKETVKEDSVKDRMEDFFGGLSLEDLQSRWMGRIERVCERDVPRRWTRLGGWCSSWMDGIDDEDC